MWNLQSEKEGKRTYVNSTTGSKCITVKVYTDKDGNDWWGFEDLLTIPFTRQFASTKVSSLYALGFSKDDLSNHINSLKTVLKSQDKEKYEKAYALVLDFESRAENATDALKQLTSLVCVYYMINDEAIDSFENNLQLRKLQLLEADPEAHAFFLKRQMQDTEGYIQRLIEISKIASVPQPEIPEVSV